MAGSAGAPAVQADAMDIVFASSALTGTSEIDHEADGSLMWLEAAGGDVGADQELRLVRLNLRQHVVACLLCRACRRAGPRR